LCRGELRAYENKIVGNCKSNPKFFYKYINDIVKVKEGIRAISDENGVLITDPVRITNTFNEWFFTVFKKESCDNMPIFSLSTTLCDKLVFDPIDIEEKLSKLVDFKSIGPDNIHPYVLK
jgi:hypothetical protein